MSNLSKLLNRFKNNFPEDYKSKVDEIETFVTNYITKNDIKIKFLNSCSTNFAGVRTKDQVIICSPSMMQNLGDFLYTIFHEIRHEQQIRDIKMLNPLTDYDLNEFEELYAQYWEMELDSDQFAKNMIAKIVQKFKIPMDVAVRNFRLSNYIQNYPMMSQGVKNAIQMIIGQIKQIKKSGGEYEDIQDHPMIRIHLQNLEDFI